VVLESRQVTEAGAFPIKKMPVRVSSAGARLARRDRAALQLPANDAFQYHAGQYVEFLLRDGDRRSYSMANAPHTQAAGPQMELHIRHMPGGKFTDHVFGTMKEKDILRIEGPYGSFYLREDSTSPWCCWPRAPASRRSRPSSSTCSTKASPPGHAVLGRPPPGRPVPARWIEAQLAMPHLRYVPVISDALPEDGWTGRTGFVHQAVLQDFPDLSGHEVYACGAPIVVESARRDYLARRPARESLLRRLLHQRQRTSCEHPPQASCLPLLRRLPNCPWRWRRPTNTRIVVPFAPAARST
jgi:CDP-4-dehydro-6-deoxyglucose reductase, E3